MRHAVSHGYTVTIFTRGRRTADLPTSVERLVRDRNGQLGALEGRSWDGVIHDSATNPEWVRMSTELLADSGQYLVTSSTGVYYPYLTRGVRVADRPYCPAGAACRWSRKKYDRDPERAGTVQPIPDSPGRRPPTSDWGDEVVRVNGPERMDG